MRRALVVDDGLVNRQLVKALLEQAEFEVEVAEHGAVALEVCRRSEGFDLILMDLDMPVMDGFEAAAAIRQLGPARGGASIYALSTLMGGAAIARARAAGMDGHLAKPFDPACFARDLRRVLARTRFDAPVPPCEPTGPPVWNREPYEDFVRRLGADRMAAHLELFRVKLIRIADALRTEPDDQARLAWEAHALVSSAGALGFEELTVLSARAQRVEPGTEVRPLSLALVAAIERGLATLPRNAAAPDALAAGREHRPPRD